MVSNWSNLCIVGWRYCATTYMDNTEEMGTGLDGYSSTFIGNAERSNCIGWTNNTGTTQIGSTLNKNFIGEYVEYCEEEHPIRCICAK